VRVAEVGHIRAKLDLLAQSPFDESLYLDSDTRVVYDLRDVFDVLDRCDVAMCHDFARKRSTMAQLVPEYAAIPYAFPEFNGGVILYSRSEAARQRLTGRLNSRVASPDPRIRAPPSILASGPAVEPLRCARC
jgi:lipopolysaccharide biosynthesis glycosyltransferase